MQGRRCQSKVGEAGREEKRVGRGTGENPKTEGPEDKEPGTRESNGGLEGAEGKGLFVDG